jgi:hypothetical protein
MEWLVFFATIFLVILDIAAFCVLVYLVVELGPDIKRKLMNR